MTDGKINELVDSMQKKLMSHMQMDPAAFKKATTGQLLSAMKCCDDDFSELYIAMEKIAGAYVRNFINKCRHLYNVDWSSNIEDIWHDFAGNRLIKAIRGYEIGEARTDEAPIGKTEKKPPGDERKKASFRTYAINSINMQLNEEVRKQFGSKLRVDPIDDGGSKHPVHNPMERFEDKDALIWGIRTISRIVNGIKFREAVESRRILVYHCKKLLYRAIGYKADVYEWLEQMKDYELTKAADCVETGYSISLETDAKFMEDYQERIQRDGVAGRPFLSGVDIRRDTTEWVRQVHSKLLEAAEYKMIKQEYVKSAGKSGGKDRS